MMRATLRNACLLAMGLALASPVGCKGSETLSIELIFPNQAAQDFIDFVDVSVLPTTGCSDFWDGESPPVIQMRWRADRTEPLTADVLGGYGSIWARGYTAAGDQVLEGCAYYDDDPTEVVWLELLDPYSRARIFPELGGGQRAPVGGLAPLPLVVRVTDFNQSGVEGAVLDVSLSGGTVVDADTGAANPPTVTTNDEGLATLLVTMPTTFEPVEVIFSADDIGGVPLLNAPLSMVVWPDVATSCTSGTVACAGGLLTCTMGGSPLSLATCATGTCAVTGNACETFTPSNIGDGTIFTAAAGGGVINLPTGTVVFNSDTGQVAVMGGAEIRPAGGEGTVLGGIYYDRILQPTPGGPWPELAIFAVEGDLDIPAGRTVRVVGSAAVAFVAGGSITIDGTLDVSGRPGAGLGCAAPDCGDAGPGGFAGATPTTPGLGPGRPGRGDRDSPTHGAAGAGYGGFGGSAGSSPWGDGGAPSGGRPYGNIALMPLVGGTGGGANPERASSGGGGGGGGAVQLVARVAVTITGLVHAGGGGGAAGSSADESAGGGGGSGGAILIEAPTVTVTGTLAANGGAGAANCGGAEGEDGQPSRQRALGGICGTQIDAAGGDGGAGDSPNGSSADGDSSGAAGSGGAGVGRIRVNGSTISVLSSGVSPTASTPCDSDPKSICPLYTEGPLHP